ncbi:MAG: alanine--tRNA ligase [Candidatus Rokuibacteriota bacterium]|nr:MAG: alanine--tRNA ligase [Candidatus Rokubacteria bacterium]
MSGSEIREAFLKYFERHGHTRVRSSSLVPGDDPTLLFTNAGMVQFKGVFLGEERREYTRATTCQKCVRAGGKHNDLENVGRTGRHHTFFEMLGNFSFGDYFKADAIAFAWELLTKDFGLPRDRLWATVFTDDDDAFKLWKRVAGLRDDRILRLGEEDNFWAMGDTGPCGPCSEIHFHQGDHLPCAEAAAGRSCLGPACECDRWLEIWNLVFMQFARDASGALTPLPKPSIDTGMGLERMAAVLQGKLSNFDTDLLRPLIDRVASLVGRPYGATAENDVSMRVVADHARASAFLIADGVTPSNEWRGYVLRRIMRRAMRHGRMLGLHEPFLWRAVEWVGQIMAPAYPELSAEMPRVQHAVRAEEERFAETLDVGIEKIREYIETHARDRERVVDGRFLFILYDTHGFPTDLAQEVFADAGFAVSDVSMREFEAEMARQRARARAGAGFGEGAGGSEAAALQLLTSLPDTEFLGYDTLTAPARILAIVVDGRRKAEIVEGEEAELILDRTPLYAESGGQQGDTGSITGREGQARVLDTQKRGTGLFVHRVKVTRGGLREGEEVAASVESPRRLGLALHHTGTHLLHAALRRVLGTHATQAGSLVAPGRLRFDFSHGQQVKDREIEQIEDLVNEKVRENIVVNPFWTELDAALKMGALAMFGEKYGQRVRVVRIGDFSTELCGGTHLDQTGQIGLFKVIDEGAVASGVRRIEAVTGAPALQYVGQEEAALREAAGILKIAPLEVPKRLQKLLDEQRTLEKQRSALEARLARSRAEELVASARTVNGVTVVAARVDGLDAEALRVLADTVRDRLGSGVVAAGTVADDKVSLVVTVSKDLTHRFNAGKLIQPVARMTGGGGGGRPDLAQAGGRDPAKLDDALALVYDLIAGSK